MWCLLQFFIQNTFPLKRKKFNELKARLSSLLSNQLIVKNETFHFKLVGCSCDNLGAHELLGMSTSFSAKYSCRFCKMSSTERQELYRPNKFLKRTHKSLTLDHEVFQNLKGSVSHVYGVKGINLMQNIIDYSPELEIFFIFEPWLIWEYFL